VLPEGRLRERVAAAGRADAWIVPPEDLERAAVRAASLGVPRVFAAKGEAGPLRWLEPFGALLAPAPKRVVAIAGIADPARFLASLRDSGFDVVASRTWRDHHPFTAADGRVVKRLIAETGAELAVTTEKDAVRWLPHRPLPFPLAWRPWSLTVEPADDFRQWLLDRVARAKGVQT
jgi:tetraacyldisaccharide-1-P 4'-kinase